MSYYDGFTPSLELTVRIARDDRVILDTTVGVKGVADEIEKAKSTLKNLLDEYAPSVNIPLPEPQAYTEPEPAPESVNTEASKPEMQTSRIPKQSGIRGLIRMECPECGAAFWTFLKERQTEIACKCGNVIDLTANLAAYRFICPGCGKETWGKTT